MIVSDNKKTQLLAEIKDKTAISRNVGLKWKIYGYGVCPFVLLNND